MNPETLDFIMRWGIILAHGGLLLCILVLFGAAIFAGPQGVSRFWTRVLTVCACFALVVCVVMVLLTRVYMR
jgi:hypothetical protein